MQLPDNGRDKAPTRQLLLTNETSSSENGLHLMKFLAKGVPWELSNHPGYFQYYWLLSTN